MKNLLDKFDIFKYATKAYLNNNLPEFLEYLNKDDIKSLKYYLLNNSDKMSKEMLYILNKFEINKNSKEIFIRTYK